MLIKCKNQEATERCTRALCEMERFTLDIERLAIRGVEGLTNERDLNIVKATLLIVAGLLLVKKEELEDLPIQIKGRG
jgi:hypothetical protein